MTFVSLSQNACAQTKLGKNVPKRSHLLLELRVPMWDDISVPFIEHHACAEMNFGKNDPKRCPFTMWDDIAVPF